MGCRYLCLLNRQTDEELCFLALVRSHHFYHSLFSFKVHYDKELQVSNLKSRKFSFCWYTSRKKERASLQENLPAGSSHVILPKHLRHTSSMKQRRSTPHYEREIKLGLKISSHSKLLFPLSSGENGSFTRDLARESSSLLRLLSLASCGFFL